MVLYCIVLYSAACFTMLPVVSHWLLMRPLKCAPHNGQRGRGRRWWWEKQTKIQSDIYWPDVDCLAFISEVTYYRSRCTLNCSLVDLVSIEESVCAQRRRVTEHTTTLQFSQRDSVSFRAVYKFLAFQGWLSLDLNKTDGWTVQMEMKLELY